MPSISSLVNNISAQYPTVSTIESDHFSWDPLQKTLAYNAQADYASNFLLHELAHALLHHSSYHRDIELLTIEREAWDYARRTLAPKFDVTINDEVAENALDTYREWIHRRSLCPTCDLNGVQDSKTTYRCVHCHERWHVNEARTCRLKRTKLKITPQ